MCGHKVVADVQCIGGMKRAVQRPRRGARPRQKAAPHSPARPTHGSAVPPLRLRPRVLGQMGCQRVGSNGGRLTHTQGQTRPCFEKGEAWKYVCPKGGGGKKRVRNANRNESSRGRSLLRGQDMGNTQDHRNGIEQRLAVGGWWSLGAVLKGRPEQKTRVRKDSPGSASGIGLALLCSTVPPPSTTEHTHSAVQAGA